MELWCPEMRMVFKDVLCKSARALAYKYSSTDAIVSAGLSRVKKVLHKASRGTTADRAQTLLDVVCQSKALRSGQKARHRSILNHLARLEMIEEQKETLKADMEQMLSLLPESRRLISVKGIGVVISAIILGECGNIGDYDEKQLEKLLGLNLCEFSSGKYKGKRKISKCGRAAVRYALCLAATRMAGKGGIYQDVAERMRAGGKNFGQIRIAVARKLLRLLHSLVKNDEDFDLQRFVARRRTGDDLLAHQDSQPLSAA
jgi:transposase